MNIKNVKRFILIAVLLTTSLGLVFLANFNTSINVGIDGRYKQIRMPLYVKWTQFVARHYEYTRIAQEITRNCSTDEEKALAILDWTRKNIKDAPAGMPVCDDHILNIIIRGYGVPEQFQDVFITLCDYAGMPAFYDKLCARGREDGYVFSFVKINGRWSVFDAYHNIYFRNSDGAIASIDDMEKDPSILDKSGYGDKIVHGVPYKEFYAGLKTVTPPHTLRAENQKPLKRLLFEIRKALKMEKPDDDTA